MARARLLLLGMAFVAGAMNLPASPARAKAPDAATLYRELGLSAADVQRVMAGEMVPGTLPASNERELVATLAFAVKGLTPAELVKKGKKGLLDRVDPNTIAFQLLEGAPSLADFAKFTLTPNPRTRARAYAAARPGEAMNLSAQEIAAFHELGANAGVGAVERVLRNMLLTRLEAYQSKGLDGIAPYARAGGEERSPGEDLRSASRTLKKLQQYVPDAYAFLLDYPRGRPAGTEETFVWSQIQAHGVPTVVLTQKLYIPDGDAWVAVQRQFYVSTGYNCEQAVAAFLPVSDGTAVFYENRTSTDQVMGWAGRAERSIGSRVLESSLESLFERLRAKASQ
jgi:hypothetical protein